MLCKITDIYCFLNEAEMAKHFSFFCNSFFNLVSNFSLATKYLILAMRSSQPGCCQLTKEEPVYVYLIFRIFLCKFLIVEVLSFSTQRIISAIAVVLFSQLHLVK